ncbi:unnamed protein product [Ectocarpus sp. 12 AP-2014]
MDCSGTPHHQLRVLADALAEGHVPRLERLYVRVPRSSGSEVELLALKRAAGSRSPPVELELQIKAMMKYCTRSELW